MADYVYSNGCTVDIVRQSGGGDTGGNKVTYIYLNYNTYKFTNTNAVQLVATVFPDDASNKTINWVSSDSTIATVNSSTGLVTPIGDGTCTITANATDGSGVKGICSIEVVLNSSGGGEVTNNYFLNGCSLPAYNGSCDANFGIFVVNKQFPRDMAFNKITLSQNAERYLNIYILSSDGYGNFTIEQKVSFTAAIEQTDYPFNITVKQGQYLGFDCPQGGGIKYKRDFTTSEAEIFLHDGTFYNLEGSINADIGTTRSATLSQLKLGLAVTLIATN